MAKTLAPATTSGTLAKPSDLRSSFDLADSDGLSLTMIGRLSVWNGSPRQKQDYGGGKGFDDGDLIDMMEKRKTKTNKIVPVHGFTLFQRWDKDAKAPTYTYFKHDKHRVPAEDMERGADDSPPACYEALGLVCLVVGEPVPYLFTFKRTSKRAGDDIVRHEMRRSTIGRSPGVYTIGVKSDKNPAGQDYLRVVLNGVPADMDDDTSRLFAVVSSQIDKAKALAQDAAAKGDDDDLPI